MVEGWVVRVLISQDFGGLWNSVRRLVETDNYVQLVLIT